MLAASREIPARVDHQCMSTARQWLIIVVRRMKYCATYVRIAMAAKTKKIATKKEKRDVWVASLSSGTVLIEPVAQGARGVA